MKKWICRWMLLFLLLPGCGGAPAPKAGEDAAFVPTPENGVGLCATQLEAEPRPPMEEEILAAYYRAEEAYGWFELVPLPSSGEAVRLTGAAYRRVDYPGMETMDDLRAYLRNLFSAELTDQIGRAHV